MFDVFIIMHLLKNVDELLIKYNKPFFSYPCNIIVGIEFTQITDKKKDAKNSVQKNQQNKCLRKVGETSKQVQCIYSVYK